ncbi:MAG: 30S ribosomal protein S4 [Hyphomicrobiales bacterium]|nr:30S ribosomal protein S4 [Rickettsiales bacterium]MCP5361674.1 30S ribosomal protein S4 [Hyphomicrobiales bacterium]
MSKRHNAKYKISRRLGAALWGRDKDPQNKKNYAPGQHGPSGRRRMDSDFGQQLRAKQQLKGYYGNISERQFRAIYKEAVRLKGDTSENLIGLLESRLDAVIYRLNFVPTVFAARQFINHKHVLVNGKAVNIPSYRVKEGDVIQVKSASRQVPIVLEALETMERDVPEYLLLSSQKEGKGTFVRKPTFAEVPYPVHMEPNLVIEFYSR